MDYSQPFSALNDMMKPQFSTSQQLYSSLSRVEDRQMNSLRSRAPLYRPTVLPTEPEPKVSTTAPELENPEEPEDDAEQEDLVCDGVDEGNSANLLHINTCLISELNLKDVDEEEPNEEDNRPCQTEEKDSSVDLTSEGTGDSSESVASSGEGGSPYIDRTLPDLIKSGRPLGRRRTLGHVSDTLKEVRREVELSRRRSIRLKAQVDKLQEGRDGPGWSQHRERVTEEVLSVLRLLHPLTEPESSQAQSSNGENRLDTALAQLQNVARKLAISHTQQIKSGKGTGAEDGAILQQALRDRDEAIEKKKAMEAELLRSKTEMMSLNNQLLEAVQKRLELSLELEAWKEDVQLILQQQLKSQQEAEQAQKKPSRLGLLRRNNKPLNQRPSNFPQVTPVPPTTNKNQIFITKSAGSSSPAPTASSRKWNYKLRRGTTGRQGDQDSQPAECSRENDGFHVVTLD
ncbi:bicaudal-D-related protein 2-like isoform X2 [Scomber japonicus]|uniref:bicaudal-D-related protein 2-like isoform X2 n=1 Tax=Scomber japonicus TaxID=13676 RepID=UPI0023060CDE|nr:bicaudal-D-related protein 2-like isoform X2 [Scomber japonicus]